jgi:hypothetical protein
MKPGPQSKEEAELELTCEQHAVSDFEMQLSILELELKLAEEETPEIQEPYLQEHLDKIFSMKERKIKLLSSTRFHQNIANAYWYYLANINK